MEDLGRARRVRIYVNEGDLVGHRQAHLAILQFLRREHARGATVLRAIEGFGATGRLHVSHLLDVDQRLPVVVEWIDDPATVERLLPRLTAAIPVGLVTVDETEVAFASPGPVRDLPATLTAADVMTRQVVAVAPSTPLREVVARMLGKAYRAVPVVEDGRPVGMIGNTDLVEKGGLGARVDLLESLARPELQALLDRLAEGELEARSVMTPHPVVVAEDTTLPELAELMTRRKLKRLPVVDGEGRLTGVVSRVDLLRVAAGGFAAPEAPPRELGLSGDVPLGRILRRDFPTLSPDSGLPEVYRAILSTRLHRALVVDDERKVVGLVTDAELLEKTAPVERPGALRALMGRLPFGGPQGAAEAGRPHVAADVMRTDVPQATEDTRLGAAIGMMLAGSQKVLAVTDSDGRVVGLVDRADLLHGLLPPA